jgi:hypothetical protein
MDTNMDDFNLKSQEKLEECDRQFDAEWDALCSEYGELGNVPLELINKLMYGTKYPEGVPSVLNDPEAYARWWAKKQAMKDLGL